MADQVATTELIIKLPSVMTAEYFTSEDEIEKLIAKVKAVADAHVPDLSTAKSRAATKSIAFQVSQTKAEIIRQGKKLTEGWRDQTKLVNTACNIFEERLDRLRDQVKKPVSDWEKQEESRIDSHKARLDTLIAYSKTGFGRSSADLKSLLAEVKSVELGEGSWQEFASQASVASKNAIDTLTGLLELAEKQEADAAELDRLRVAEAERVRQEAVRLSAEQAKQEEAARAERARLAEEQRKADLARAAAEATERSERESAARVAAAEEAVKNAEEKAARDIAAFLNQPQRTGERRSSGAPKTP